MVDFYCLNKCNKLAFLQGNNVKSLSVFSVYIDGKREVNLKFFRQNFSEIKSRKLLQRILIAFPWFG